jgi:hypothetical protein
MWVYVDNVGVYSVYTASLNTILNIAPGKHTIMVKAWDTSGNISVSSVAITVLSGTSLIRPARASRDTTTPMTAQASTATDVVVSSTRSQRAQRLQNQMRLNAGLNPCATQERFTPLVRNMK